MSRLRVLFNFILVTILILLSYSVFANNPDLNDDNLKITIINDNYDCNKNLKADWGFSCLIQTESGNILFDAGGKEKTFKKNFEVLNFNSVDINAVVISHDHWDHIAGIETVLELNNNINVYLPSNSSKKLGESVYDNTGNVKFSRSKTEIYPNIFLSGVFTVPLYEQALVVKTIKGLVVITGCSHPGIVEMLKSIKQDFNEDIYMVMGGFHLMRASSDEVEGIISELKEIGVKRVGATHCTGKKQIEIFRESFGKNFVEMGVGRVIAVK